MKALGFGLVAWATLRGITVDDAPVSPMTARCEEDALREQRLRADGTIARQAPRRSCLCCCTDSSLQCTSCPVLAHTREQGWSKTGIALLPHVKPAPMSAAGPSGEPQEHLYAIIAFAGPGQRRRLFRILDILKIKWATVASCSTHNLCS